MNNSFWIDALCKTRRLFLAKVSLEEQCDRLLIVTCNHTTSALARCFQVDEPFTAHAGFKVVELSIGREDC
jgi:hypothetical protein